MDHIQSFYEREESGEPACSEPRPGWMSNDQQFQTWVSMQELGLLSDGVEIEYDGDRQEFKLVAKWGDDR